MRIYIQREEVFDQQRYQIVFIHQNSSEVTQLGCHTVWNDILIEKKDDSSTFHEMSLFTL